MFWEKFKALCDSKGLKPNQFAKQNGIASGTITAWKKGAEPSLKYTKKIAEHFGVSVEYLKGKELQPKTEQMQLTNKEKLIILRYRESENKKAIDKLLDIDDSLYINEGLEQTIQLSQTIQKPINAK